MFSAIGQWFREFFDAAGQGGTALSVPSYSEPPVYDTLPTSAPVLSTASIRIEFRTSREFPGTLTCLNASGNTVNGPWAARGKANPDMAAKKGNPNCESRYPFGDTPLGVYEISERLPARVDAEGMRLFGSCDALRLQPVSGDAAVADSFGRTALLIHGGDENMTTDGSVRVSDTAMKAILASLPDNPGTAVPRIRVDIIQADDSGNYTWYPPSSSSYDDDDTWFLLYQQMYLFDTWSSPSDPYVGMVQPDNAIPETSDPDMQAASSLSALGYETLSVPEPQSPVSLTVPDSDPSYTPNPTPPFVEDAPASAVLSTSSWEPSGGSYGR